MDEYIQDDVNRTSNFGVPNSNNAVTEHQNEQNLACTSVSSPVISTITDSEECNLENSDTKFTVHEEGLPWERRINAPRKPKRITTNSLLTRNKKQYSLYYQSVNHSQAICIDDQFLKVFEFDILCFPKTYPLNPKCYHNQYKVAYFTHKPVDEVGTAILLRPVIQYNTLRDLCYYDCDESGSKIQAACIEIEKTKLIILCVSADSENPYHSRILNHIFKQITCKRSLIVCGNFSGNTLLNAKLKSVFGEAGVPSTCLKTDDIFYQKCHVLHRETAEKNTAMGIKFKN